MIVPHHNLNCHTVIYGTEGRCWIEVVAENGEKVFDGEVREGQILIVPQHFVVVKKAGSEGFGWIAVKTNDNPMMEALAGELSLIRSMPDAVLMHSYRLTIEEVKQLKKRRELTLLSPRQKSSQANLDMAFSSLLFLSIALLVITQSCSTLAGEETEEFHYRKCSLERLIVLEPSRVVESEGGKIEYWDDHNEQLRCVGVALVRYTIRPKGLLLPFYTNVPRIHYVLKGRGVQETIVAGCRESYRSQSDEHQKINAIQQDDAVAVPSSSAQWFYNTGDSDDLVLFSLIHTANKMNQLDLTFRSFFLGGNPQEEPKSSNRSKRWGWNHREWQQKAERSGGNVFSGLAPETVANSLNIATELADKVQGIKDSRGAIILVEDGLGWLSPEQEEEEREREKRHRSSSTANGVEETLCSLAYVHPLGEPRMHADKYNPRGGHLTSLNTPNMPILEHLQLGVDRGVLYEDAIMVPHCNLNCHAVIYCTRGSGWLQVVGENGRMLFDGEVKEGQVLVVPQHYVVVKKGGAHAFDWVAIKTNDNPMINPLAGELSLVHAMPDAVLMNSFLMNREEVMGLKNTRKELTFISPAQSWSPT
ncbi:legumin B-like [Neltuma alba]|uniref:legumin B-like n=1 Tax=Neltuma alba TaxID=207710 RepID=UPI0010A31A1A|nr:legumin B-like [Prosopis alba]